MGKTFGIHNLVNILHKAIVECVKIFSHFSKNCSKYTYTFIIIKVDSHEDYQGYHRIDHP